VLTILADQEVARAHVAGHDWGAALDWVLASVTPDKVDHLVALSVGNPATFLRTFEQRQMAWYMLLFQFSDVAERWLTDDGWANFRSWARHPDANQVIAMAQNAHFGESIGHRGIRWATDHIGGSARGYQAIFVPSTALARPGYDVQLAVYLYIAALEVNALNRG
jgi:pimeloyl-ACP methyl ester carboxylesterase